MMRRRYSRLLVISTSLLSSRQANGHGYLQTPRSRNLVVANMDVKQNCKDDSRNYFEATSDCTGYVYCMKGVANEPTPCGEGMLYSQNLQYCDWETSVTCGEEDAEDNEQVLLSAESDEKKNCKDDSYNYFEATSDCTGYIYCMKGVPNDPTPCGQGMLYSQNLQRCVWETSVKCEGAEDELFDEDGNPKPTKSPTARPTQPPNSLLDWDPNVIDRGYSKTIIGYVSRTRCIICTDFNN